MKRKLLNRTFLKQTVLAVPAAALMLGQSQAATSVGINFWGNYANYNYGFGPVTAVAFGLPPANWSTTPGGDYIAAGTGSMSVGALTVNWSSANTWISALEGDPLAVNGPWNTPLPGDPEVLWGLLDDGNASVQAPAASISGLSSVFPNGYVIQTIAAIEANPMTFANVNVTNAVTTNTLVYSKYFHTYDWYGPVAGANAGTYALSPQSAVFTGDTIGLQCDLKGTTGTRSTLCGFIITDKPVVSAKPVGGTYNEGASFTLDAGAVGIPPISYQWRRGGINIPGATLSSYTVASSTQAADAGEYDLVAANTYGSGTSVVATVNIRTAPVILTDVPSITNTIYAGFNKTLSVVAAGAPTLKYQWNKDGAPIAGATTASLVLSNVQTTDIAGYSVTVTNTYGPVSSSTNHLLVVVSPDPLYAAQVGKDKPLGYWPLNEVAPETNVFDYAGNGLIGAQNGSLSIGFDGPKPPAFLGFNTAKTGLFPRRREQFYLLRHRTVAVRPN